MAACVLVCVLWQYLLGESLLMDTFVNTDLIGFNADLASISAIIVRVRLMWVEAQSYEARRCNLIIPLVMLPDPHSNCLVAYLPVTE